MNLKNVLRRRWQGMSQAVVKLRRKLVWFFSLFPPKMFHWYVSLLPSCNATIPVTQPRLTLAWAVLPFLFLLPLHPPHCCISAGGHEGNHLEIENSLCGPSTTGDHPGNKAAPKQERKIVPALACKKMFLARDVAFPSSPTGTFEEENW